MFFGCATLMLKSGVLSIVKQVPFSTQFVCLCIDVVEGAIFFKAFRKDASLFGEISKYVFSKQSFSVFWGMWFSRGLLSSLFAFQSSCLNIMNVSVVVTSFCPTKGLLQATRKTKH